MLTRKAMEDELVKRYGTTNVWFIDWNWSDSLENLDNQQINDIYNKAKGQFKDFQVFVAEDLRRQTYGNKILVLTKKDFKSTKYYEHQWDPHHNSKGFRDGFVMNAYEDTGDIIHIFSSTAVERIDNQFYIGDYFDLQPNEGCEVI